MINIDIENASAASLRNFTTGDVVMYKGSIYVIIGGWKDYLESDDLLKHYIDIVFCIGLPSGIMYGLDVDAQVNRVDATLTCKIIN
jgi:hypothetical protein